MVFVIFDKNHKITEINHPTFQQKIHYDALGRTSSYTTNEILHTCSYDGLSQLIRETNHTYKYDTLFNRTVKDGHTQTFNELCQPKDHHYDPNGNLKQLDDLTFHYDALDRLIQVDKGDETYHYSYDWKGRRLTKTTPTKTENFLYCFDDEMGTLQELRIFGLKKGADIGATIAIEIDGKPYAPIHDAFGNIAALDNTVTHFTAFGEEDNPTLSPWRFSSKRHDPETNLVFFGKRYYSPKLGRWITSDPARFIDGLNTYAYVHNNPLLYNDLYGLWLWESTKGVGYGFGMGVCDMVCGSYQMMRHPLDSTYNFYQASAYLFNTIHEEGLYNFVTSRASAFGEHWRNSNAFERASMFGGAASWLVPAAALKGAGKVGSIASKEAALFMNANALQKVVQFSKVENSVIHLPWIPNMLQGNEKYGLKHVFLRHSYETSCPRVSKFAKGMGEYEVKELVREACMSGVPWKIEDNYRILNVNLGRTIGTGRHGKPVSWLRIVTHDNQLITTYPFVPK